jgi:hypothetical protein
LDCNQMVVHMPDSIHRHGHFHVGSCACDIANYTCPSGVFYAFYQSCSRCLSHCPPPILRDPNRKKARVELIYLYTLIATATTNPRARRQPFLQLPQRA